MYRKASTTKAMISASGRLRRGFLTSPPMSASATMPDQVMHASTIVTMNIMGPPVKSGVRLTGFRFVVPAMPKMVMPIRRHRNNITCSQDANFTPKKLITAKKTTTPIASTHAGAQRPG